MVFSLSELLNPEPGDSAISLNPGVPTAESQRSVYFPVTATASNPLFCRMDPTEPPATFFAPELFQPDDEAIPEDEAFNRKVHIMDDEPLFQSGGRVHNDDGVNDEDHVKQETL